MYRRQLALSEDSFYEVEAPPPLSLSLSATAAATAVYTKDKSDNRLCERFRAIGRSVRSKDGRADEFINITLRRGRTAFVRYGVAVSS